MKFYFYQHSHKSEFRDKLNDFIASHGIEPPESRFSDFDNFEEHILRNYKGNSFCRGALNIHVGFLFAMKMFNSIYATDDEGKVIGGMAFGIERDGSRLVVKLQTLCSPVARSNVGKRLLDIVIEVGKFLGAHSVLVNALRKNVDEKIPTAADFYRKHGFTRVINPMTGQPAEVRPHDTTIDMEYVYAAHATPTVPLLEEKPEQVPKKAPPRRRRTTKAARLQLLAEPPKSKSPVQPKPKSKSRKSRP
jgi:hypothetical protein